jgi:formyltetrahydrofolate-dependent phosphoribosylglycinamide formyltransferase
MPRLAVLVSGHGSNLQAILDAAAAGQLPGVEVALVVSNRKEAYGIQRAVQAGVPVVYFPLAPYTRAGRRLSGGAERSEGPESKGRSTYDADLAAILHAFGAEWVVLAGWMHVLSNAFLHHFPSRVVNLHPALPGTFPGTHAIQWAYEAFQRGEIAHTGVMVHLVPDEGVDVGPAVAQEVVPIYPQDTLEELEARIHAVEHRLLVRALCDKLCRE